MADKHLSYCVCGHLRGRHWQKWTLGEHDFDPRHCRTCVCQKYVHWEGAGHPRRDRVRFPKRADMF